MAEAHKAQISKLKGIREPARGINGQDYCNERRQLHFPTKMWATHTESVHGQEAQLMLWPHFWRNAEAAEYRHRGKYSRTGNPVVGNRTLLERFSEHLEEVGPMGWREEYVDFKPVTHV